MKNSIEEFLDSNEYWGETENAHNSCLVVEVDKLRDFLASQPTAQGVDTHKAENMRDKQSCDLKVSDKAAQGGSDESTTNFIQCCDG